MRLKTQQLIDLKKYYHNNGWKIDDFNMSNIRNMNNLRKDVFNDLQIFFINSEGYAVQNTTDPGKRCIENKGPGNGALFLKEGFHENSLCLDLHNQRVKEAFCSRPGKRYSDGKFAGCEPQIIIRIIYDEEWNIISQKEYTGFFGANVHNAHNTLIVKNIGRYGEGCRVVLRNKDFKFMKSTAKKTDMFLKNPNVTLFSESIFNLDQEIGFINDIYRDFYGKI